MIAGEEGMKKTVFLSGMAVLFMTVLSYAVQPTPVIPLSVVELINKNLPNSTIAERSDFSGCFSHATEEYGINLDRYLNTVIIADLNCDSIADYTVLLINRLNRSFTFVTFLSSQGNYVQHILSRTKWPIEHDGKIWQTMWLKPAGDPGISKEKYFNAPGKEYPYLKPHDEKDIKEYEDAIRRYVNMTVIEKTDAPYGSFEADDIFYCKSSYYFEDGKMKKVQKCD